MSVVARRNVATAAQAGGKTTGLGCATTLAQHPAHPPPPPNAAAAVADELPLPPLLSWQKLCWLRGPL